MSRQIDWARWRQTPAGYVQLPPLAECPVCGDAWIDPRGRTIGPRPGVTPCGCRPSEWHTTWRCWRCHAILAEGCADTTKWGYHDVDDPVRLGQVAIDEQQARMMLCPECGHEDLCARCEAVGWDN